MSTTNVNEMLAGRQSTYGAFDWLDDLINAPLVPPLSSIPWVSDARGDSCEAEGAPLSAEELAILARMEMESA